MSDAKTLPLSADDALAIADKYLVSYEVVQLIAQEALRARLAEPDDEPVAWMDDFGNAFPLAANKGAGSWIDAHKRSWNPLYTRPAARKVQPLTEHQIDAICGQTVAPWIHAMRGTNMNDFARAIERAHGITGDSQ